MKEGLGRQRNKQDGCSILPQGFEGRDVGDRVRVELIGTDVEREFIDFPRAGKRQGGQNSARPGREIDHYKSKLLRPYRRGIY